MVRPLTYALSLKQPWAGLLVGGRKVVEIRTWATNLRGTIYIHAARSADDRLEAWARVPAELRPLCQRHGGIVGRAELIACIPYHTSAAFEADAGRHLNPPEWYVAARTYGFEFRTPAVVPFAPYRGSTRFFTVELTESE
ncbi:MAG TPA: ASCH domain-containing protein [Gemmataceae bacterium]|nr:ASCH domain-containing protein [Gemmataceae bacterium]